MSAKKYDWVALKHVYTGMESNYFICSSIFKCWRRKTIPSGGTTPPKEVVFYKSKMFLLYLDKDYEEYPKYGYTIYWLDVLSNICGFSFVPITHIRCMPLALYNNQLNFLINDGSTSVWALEEIENFQFFPRCLEQQLDYFEDDWGFKWILLHDISADINIKCHGYLPLRSLHQLVLMCNLAELHFILYDLMIDICLQTTLNDVSMLHNFDSHSPLFQHHSPLIENGNIFGILPHVDSVDDIPPLIEYI